VGSDNRGSELLQNVCDYLPIKMVVCFLVYSMFGLRWPRGLRRSSAVVRFAGITGSNPAEDIDVLLVWWLYVVLLVACAKG